MHLEWLSNRKIWFQEWCVYLQNIYLSKKPAYKKLADGQVLYF